MPFGAVAGAAASAAISAGASALSSGAADSGAAKATAAQQAQIAQDNANLQPYVTTGQNALSQLGNLSGANGTAAETGALNNFTGSPGYTYAVSQGLNAVDHGAASIGLLNSGAAIRAEQTLGNNLANQNFQQYFNNLSTLSNQGQTAASSLAGVTGNQTSGIAQTDASAGAANASIYAGLGSALGGDANTALTSTPVKNALSSLFSSTPTTGSGLGAAP